MNFLFINFYLYIEGYLIFMILCMNCTLHITNFSTMGMVIGLLKMNLLAWASAYRDSKIVTEEKENKIWIRKKNRTKKKKINNPDKSTKKNELDLLKKYMYKLVATYLNSWRPWIHWMTEMTCKDWKRQLLNIFTYGACACMY